MPADLDPTRLDDFRSRLLAHPRKRVDRVALWTHFAAAFPGRPQGADEQRWFLSALEHLAAARVVRLPSRHGRLWEHSMGLAIPTSVEIVREPALPRSETWRTFPWHPRLNWIPDLRALTAEQVRFLTKVHDGFVNNQFAKPAPLKYRSLQLTGDEKRLLYIASSRLFATGRLDFDLLGCIDERLPMAWHGISPKPVMLVLENTGTFSVARRLLQSLQSPLYGLVGFGGGAALEHAVRYLRTIERPVHEIHYVGDLDRAGLRIVQAARKAAHQEGLPDIRPAPGLHAVMLKACDRFGEPLGWPHDTAVEGPLPQDNELLEWLPVEIRARAREIIHAARRVPEEILGPDELASAWTNRTES